VTEPSVEDTISILRGLKSKYEVHHGVRITDSAVIAAATLSNRYITDRRLPDKAIDLIDEAAAHLRTEIDSKPQALDDVDREIMQLEIEKQALQIEKDQASRERLEKLEAELADLREKSKALTAQWQAEKEAIQSFKDLKEKLDQAQQEMEQAERNADLEKASRLRYGTIRELENKIREAELKLQSQQKQGALLKEEVDAEEIASVVAKWTGIPVNRLLEGEMEKLLHMEERLHQRVVGQDEAIIAVSNAVRRSRSGMQDPNRPIGSFIFLGPTGVGKTELVKALAEALFETEDAMVRLDMSEFMEPHTVSKLIGSPPGYVGYDDGGQLTEKIRRKPYSVILLDEIEKAHADVFNILLQILDDGRLTDSHGRLVSFENTVIVMTSNAGTTLKANAFGFGADGYVALESRVQTVLKEMFRPEFLNRVDEIVVFSELSKDEIRQIVDLMLKEVSGHLSEKGLQFVVTDAAKDYLAEKGYDPKYGARPLRKTIQRLLEDPLADLVLAGHLKNASGVSADYKDGQIKLDWI